MNASLFSEKRISLTDLAQDQGVNISTVWRWCQRGCRGHKLESFNVGWKRFTTLPAYQRWLAAINGGASSTGQTPLQRERAIDAAERELDAMGV